MDSYFFRGGRLAENRKITPPSGPKLSMNKIPLPRTPQQTAICQRFFIFFSKKVLTGASDSCNIIQVADRHGNETAEQALNGRPLKSSKKLQKNFKKVLDKLIWMRYDKWVAWNDRHFERSANTIVLWKLNNANNHATWLKPDVWEVKTSY